MNYKCLPDDEENFIKTFINTTEGKIVVLYCTYMHPYVYTVSRTTVQLLHRM